MTDTHVTRIVIEFYTDSEDEHETLCGIAEDFVGEHVCPNNCEENGCRLLGIKYDRLTLAQFDRELEEK